MFHNCLLKRSFCLVLFQSFFFRYMKLFIHVYIYQEYISNELVSFHLLYNDELLVHIVNGNMNNIFSKKQGNKYHSKPLWIRYLSSPFTKVSIFNKCCLICASLKYQYLAKLSVVLMYYLLKLHKNRSNIISSIPNDKRNGSVFYCMSYVFYNCVLHLQSIILNSFLIYWLKWLERLFISWCLPEVLGVRMMFICINHY